MSSSAICQRCGETFEVPNHLRERFPGWSPPHCPRCYRKQGGGSSRPGRDAAAGARKKATRSRSRTAEENLTVIDVLERYVDGPDTGVFTDGSAVPNPGPGGWGAVYVVDGDIVAQKHGFDEDTTNNRMELTAVIHGIALVPQGTPATVYTDSQLCVNTINQWAAGWERRGWKRKSGPIKNLDLVKRLYYAMQDRPELELQWIAAHSGLRWNEYADALATAWMRDEL